MSRRYSQTDPNVDREFQEVDQRVSTLEDTLSVPIGGCVLWTGNNETPPQGFLVCDGQSYAVDTYPQLYRVLERRGGTPTPNSEDNFVVPNLTVSSFNFVIRAE